MFQSLAVAWMELWKEVRNWVSVEFWVKVMVNFLGLDHNVEMVKSELDGQHPTTIVYSHYQMP